MANPQPDEFTKLSNELLEALSKIRIPGEAMQVLLVVMRLTYGWNRKEWPIGNKEFVELTGITKTHIQRAIDRLQSMNLIKVTKKGYKLTPTYCIQKDYEKWKPVTKKGNGVTNIGNKVTHNGNETALKPFDDNGSGHPKEIKEIVLTKVSAEKPQIPGKMNAPEIVKYFAALYRYYNKIEYVISWGKDTGIIQQIWISLGKDIFPIIDHYLSLENNPKIPWTMNPRTIANLRWQINAIQENWKEYA